MRSLMQLLSAYYLRSNDPLPQDIVACEGLRDAVAEMAALTATKRAFKSGDPMDQVQKAADIELLLRARVKAWEARILLAKMIKRQRTPTEEGDRKWQELRRKAQQSHAKYAAAEKAIRGLIADCEEQGYQKGEDAFWSIRTRLTELQTKIKKVLDLTK